MSAEALDLMYEFHEYVVRFESLAGPGKFGSFIKHRGRLIKKLRLEEFKPRYREYREIAKAYNDSVRNGETINDVVVKLLRERCIELLVDSPA